MSRQKIYDCLESGESLSTSELMERTGLSREDIHTVISSMSKRGMISPKPATYALTAKGQGMARRAKERRETTARPLLMARTGQLVNSVFNWR